MITEDNSVHVRLDSDKMVVRDVDNPYARK
jgi:hypothetical protein